MPKYKVGDHLLVKLSGGRIADATIKAVVETTEGDCQRRALSTVFFL